MLDIKAMRQNPEFFYEGFKKRGMDPELITQILQMDEEIRKKKTELQTLQQTRNTLSSGDKPKTMATIERAQKIKQDIQNCEEALKDMDIVPLLVQYPNIPDESVPVGKDEKDNQIIRSWGTKREFDFTPKEHFDIMPGFMDFETAAIVSGSRFVFLKGLMAQLHRALSNFFIDYLVKQGYTEMYTPYLVKDSSMFGAGQLPKFYDDLFQTTDGRWLIPTGEVPLANYVREKILSHTELPLRFVTLTPCFRKEAGSAGKDMHGMIRHHQFNKVEMVSITTPEQSKAEHERMTGLAEKLLQELGLPYQVSLLCTGDMGFHSNKTYDLEVWLPSQNTYREISSCSNCGDFQARRMNARYRNEENQVNYVHMLNGSGLAVGRALIALVENYQNADGSITIPDVLMPYMNI